MLLADKGGLPRLKGFWAGSIRFSGAKLASINERNSAHERAYRGTYRDAPPFGSIFSGASGDEYGAWACEGPCYTGLRPRNTADVTDPRFVERCYNCGCFMCAKCDCAPETQNACVACGVFCCSYCASNQYEAVLGLQYGSGRERPGPFCKACLPEGPGGYSEDDVSFQLRKYYVKN